MENIIMLLIWSIIIVTTIFSEMFLTNFITIWFGLGALGAIISIPFNLIYWQQLIIFVSISIITLLIFYPLLHKYAIKIKVVKTNIDKLINQKFNLIVNNQKNNNDNSLIVGIIKINDVNWIAINNNNEKFFDGEEVKVVNINGTRLIIEKILKNIKEVK